jgi:hypothetical protein
MYPDFLGIGAQKSGTTWLHDNLSRHPQVWLPPIKELHHLDHRPPPLVTRLLSRKQALRNARSHLRRCLAEALRGGSREDLAWATRYCLSARSDAWYGTLFPEIAGKITGEVCPGYARVSAARVAEIHRLMPDTKVIYLLRNPVERAWSALAMHFREHFPGGIDSIPEEAIEARLRRPKSWGHGEYAKNLAAWEAHYPATQMFVGFFDDLQAEPGRLLAEILGFLGLDAGEAALPDDVDRRRNPGRGEVVPPRFEQVLARVLADEVRAVNARFDNAHTHRWLAYTEERL